MCVCVGVECGCGMVLTYYTSDIQSNYSNVVIKEGTEPENFFWVALGGIAEYEHVRK